MSFFNKGSLSIIVIILIAAVIGFAIGFGGFFYWHKTYVPANNPSEDISQEEIKTKCLENVSKMNDQELINEIKNLEYIKKVAPIDEENKLNFAINSTNKYLNCKLTDNKDEQLYNIAEAFIQGLIVQKESKEKYLRSLNEAYFSESRNTFTLQLALQDWNDICSDELSSNKLDDLCLADLNVNNISNELFLGYCENTCDMIKQYYCENTCDTIEQIKQHKSQDTPSWQAINIKEWADPNDTLLYQAQYGIRTAVAYHFGKQDLALKVCDNVNDSEKDKCLEWVEIMNNLENRSKKCNDMRKELEKTICQLSINGSE